MLRYDRQTKPGLVALYDIRPGNGAGPFLQPRSPHGAIQMCECRVPATSSGRWKGVRDGLSGSTLIRNMRGAPIYSSWRTSNNQSFSISTLSSVATRLNLEGSH